MPCISFGFVLLIHHAVFHSDQGQQFTSEVITSLKNKYNIHATFSSAYHSKGNSIIERIHRSLKDRLRCMSGYWSYNLYEAIYNCNRLSGAFLNVFSRTGIPLYDWPTKSNFISRPSSSYGPQSGDFVAIRNRNPPTTLSPRFHGHLKVRKRYGNYIQIEDGRQINIHDAILVGRN